MRSGRKSLWRSTCYKTMRLWWLSTMPTQTGSLIRERIWPKTSSTMAYHLACEMSSNLRWQTCLRGSRLTPALTCCTHLPRRRKHDRPHIPTGVPLWGRLQSLRKKNYSSLILNPLTLKPWS